MSLLIDETSRLSKALNLHEGVLDYIVSLNPHDFERLRNPLMRRLMPPRITLLRIAKMTRVDIVQLLERIHSIAGAPMTEEDRCLIRRRTRDEANDDAPSTAGQAPDWVHVPSPVVVDLLESDARLDSDPVRPISIALREHPPGTTILIKHKWEPQPLYDVWAKSGVEHHAIQKHEHEWWIYVRRVT